MAGIMAAMKSFDSLGTAFSNNPAIKAIQQARQKIQGQAASQTAGVAGAAPTPVSGEASTSTDTNALEARIAALESAGSNIAGSGTSAAVAAPSSMTPGALAAGETMFGTQDARDRSIDPNIFNRRFN